MKKNPEKIDGRLKKGGKKGMKKGMKMSTGNNPNEHLNICCTQQIQLIED
jgi:hypothetical protein